MLKESSDDRDHDDTPACTPTPPMLRLYVTQVDDNGNDAISIDEWLEFWRNVLAQVTLASPQASHQPKVTFHTSSFLALEILDRGVASLAA